MTATAYPLCWPEGWRRSTERDYGRFGKRQYTAYQSGNGGYTSKKKLTVSEATGRILAELQRFGIDPEDCIISTNVVLRLDGLPRSNQAEPTDPGVAVYWQEGNRKRCMATDRYTRVADNLAAIAATLEAMRAIERHGGAEILDRAFTGFVRKPFDGYWTGGAMRFFRRIATWFRQWRLKQQAKKQVRKDLYGRDADDRDY